MAADQDHHGPVIANDEIGYSWTTYPERLQAAGVSWKIYQDIGNGLDAVGVWGFTSNPYIGNFGDNSLLYLSLRSVIGGRAADRWSTVRQTRFDPPAGS